MLLSKVSCSLLAHLATLLGLLMVQSCEGQNRQAFEWKHIDYPKSYPTAPDTYCKRMMLQKGLTRHVCKDINTFINDFPVNVVQVCRGRGIPHSNDMDSIDSFDMVICRYIGGPAPYDCRFKGPTMITTKDSCWLLLLRLAILLMVVLVQSGEGASYRDFANRHIDFPKTRANNNNAYCNLMMARRRLNTRVCKPTNTFINGSPGGVQGICRGGGTRFQGNLYNSRRRFRVVVCRNRGRFPRCNYVGRAQVKRLRVGCRNNLPVHFDRLL